jgi:peptidoglycan-N-acetylglucosamine deacetylase
MRAVPTLSLAAAAAGGAAWSAPALAPVVPAVADALGVARRIDAPGAVAVTFDDGPHAEGTPAMLEALRAAGAVATFFLVGEQVDRRPALAAEIVAAGHSVALHGHRHRLQLRLGPRAVADDLDRGHAAIAEATGVAPAVHRPPYGIYSAPGLRLVRAGGWEPLLWSRWGHDWARRAMPASIAREVTENLAAGDVLLLHDADDYSVPGSWRATAAALPVILARIAARGLKTAKAGAL